MNKYNLAYIALGMALTSLVYFVYDRYNINELYKATNSSNVSSLPAKRIDDVVVSFATSTTYYDFKYIVPEDNQLVAKEIKKNAEKWLAETNIKSVISDTQAENDFGIYPGFKYSYESKFETYDTSEYKSYVEQVYTFTGGAHGSSYYNTYVVRKSDGQKINILNDIYNANIYNFLSEYTRNNLPKELSKKSINISDFKDMFEQGTSTDKNNWGTIFFKGDKLVIVFGQYQIGPYTIGIHELEIPVNILMKYKK